MEVITLETALDLDVAAGVWRMPPVFGGSSPVSALSKTNQQIQGVVLRSVSLINQQSFRVSVPVLHCLGTASYKIYGNHARSM